MGRKQHQYKIKNIKFENFGCVAAIASSSSITVLAKGKTLTSALKIGKANVIKDIGGLPPVKVHCSLLSVDALFEAIYDYYSKNDKSKITKEMEEKHTYIKKEEEEIKERYSEWVNNEDKNLINH